MIADLLAAASQITSQTWWVALLAAAIPSLGGGGLWLLNRRRMSRVLSGNPMSPDDNGLYGLIHSLQQDRDQDREQLAECVADRKRLHEELNTLKEKNTEALAAVKQEASDAVSAVRSELNDVRLELSAEKGRRETYEVFIARHLAHGLILDDETEGDDGGSDLGAGGGRRGQRP